MYRDTHSQLKKLFAEDEYDSDVKRIRIWVKVAMARENEELLRKEKEDKEEKDIKKREEKTQEKEEKEEKDIKKREEKTQEKEEKAREKEELLR